MIFFLSFFKQLTLSIQFSQLSVYNPLFITPTTFTHSSDQTHLFSLKKKKKQLPLSIQFSQLQFHSPLYHTHVTFFQPTISIQLLDVFLTKPKSYFTSQSRPHSSNHSVYTHFSLSAEWVEAGELWLLPWGRISSGMGGGGPLRTEVATGRALRRALPWLGLYCTWWSKNPVYVVERKLTHMRTCICIYIIYTCMLGQTYS